MARRVNSQMRVMMVKTIQRIKVNLISLMLPKIRKTLTSPYLVRHKVIIFNRIFACSPGKKTVQRNKLIFPDRTNLPEGVTDVVQLLLQAVHLGSHPLPLSTVTNIVIILASRPDSESMHARKFYLQAQLPVPSTPT